MGVTATATSFETEVDAPDEAVKTITVSPDDEGASKETVESKPADKLLNVDGGLVILLTTMHQPKTLSLKKKQKTLKNLNSKKKR